MNITIIGMPAAGKTTLAKDIASRGYEMIDTDELFDLEIQDEQQFRAAEENAILQIVGDNLVIATGGGVILSEKAMRFLKSISQVIYLDVPLEIIQSRIGTARRLFGKSVEDIYRERSPLYKKYADLVIGG